MYIRKILLCVLFSWLLLFCVPRESYAAELNSKAGQVQISGGWLNVRSGPGSGTARVATLPKGSYVTLISRSGDWWKVEYAIGKFGYCHEDYIREIAGQARSVSTVSGALNVRSGAGTGHQVIGSLRRGEVVISLSSAGGWSRVLYGGTKTGYVSSQYLGESYRSVSISAANYKQMDPRWADNTIGSSGKTFSEIGCATTAIAIVETHRRGSAITPTDMEKELRYTPSGSVYWPSDYRAVTSSQDYLLKIYRRLQQGEPVLLGLKNRYGGQHWVVVTGYTGASTITASNFSIRDPGSNYRTNLQQILEEYPYFYKYFVW